MEKLKGETAWGLRQADMTWRQVAEQMGYQGPRAPDLARNAAMRFHKLQPAQQKNPRPKFQVPESLKEELDDLSECIHSPDNRGFCHYCQKSVRWSDEENKFT